MHVSYAVHIHLNFRICHAALCKGRVYSNLYACAFRIVYLIGRIRHSFAFEGLDYLPDEILFREKAAFSDAVGHSMVDYLKEYADSLYNDEDVIKAKEKYPYCPPFTKESLLYRDIFESYYPGKAKWIKDFWMPNKTWENCDVNDPSARVLKNYGDSGK